MKMRKNSVISRMMRDIDERIPSHKCIDNYTHIITWNKLTTNPHQPNSFITWFDPILQSTPLPFIFFTSIPLTIHLSIISILIFQFILSWNEKENSANQIDYFPRFSNHCIFLLFPLIFLKIRSLSILLDRYYSLYLVRAPRASFFASRTNGS